MNKWLNKKGLGIGEMIAFLIAFVVVLLIIVVLSYRAGLLF